MVIKQININATHTGDNSWNIKPVKSRKKKHKKERSIRIINCPINLSTFIFQSIFLILFILLEWKNEWHTKWKSKRASERKKVFRNTQNRRNFHNELVYEPYLVWLCIHKHTLWHRTNHIFWSQIAFNNFQIHASGEISGEKEKQSKEHQKQLHWVGEGNKWCLEVNEKLVNCVIIASSVQFSGNFSWQVGIQLYRTVLDVLLSNERHIQTTYIRWIVR